MRLAVLFSGGKDSTYALYKAIQEGHEIKYLVTVFPKDTSSWMFHYPCVELTKLQAEVIGIKQIIAETSGEKEKELTDLKVILEEIKNEIEGIVSGAIASTYQKNRIDKLCREFGLRSITPLWNKPPEQLLKEEIESGLEIIISGVSAEGFDKSWIGRKLDKNCIDDLIELNRKYKINISGEGGEFETFVLDAPIFKKKIKLLNSEILWDAKTNSGYLDVKDALLVSK